jgi:hypothetical protein
MGWEPDALTPGGPAAAKCDGCYQLLGQGGCIRVWGAAALTLTCPRPTE